MEEARELQYLQIGDLETVLRRTGWKAKPPPGISLRAADPAAEAALIARLYNDAFACEPLETITPQDVTHFAWHSGLVAFRVVIAEEEGLAVGLAVGRVEVRAAGDRSLQGAVELVAVRPGYRRRGVGRALAYHLMQWLKERGAALVGATAENPVVVDVLVSYGFQPAEPLSLGARTLPLQEPNKANLTE